MPTTAITPARKKRIVGQAFQPDCEPCQAGKPDLLPCRGNRPAGLPSIHALASKTMRHSSLFERYQELQGYVGWTELDARSIQSIAGRLEGAFHAIVADFYEEIDRHPEARRILSGGAAQVERLKITLLGWLSDLCSGIYDADYVQRRWRAGLRHAELGLDQVFCNVAMARVRWGLLDALTRGWDREPAELQTAVLALNKLLDLDLAII